MPIPGKPRHRIRRTLTNHGFEVIAAVLVLICFVWMVSYGSFEIYEPEHFGQFYDAQAAALLAGHWDVPDRDISPEAFLRDGKAYGYFGFAPAIPRMILNHILPGMTGAWSRLSAILACAVTLWCCHAFLQRARRFFQGDVSTNIDRYADAVFLLLAGLGSTLIYLGSRAFIYHEAILWGVALEMACYVQIFDYLATGRWQRLIAACILAFLSFFTRISSGSGAMLALGLLGVYIVGTRARRRLGSHNRRRDGDSINLFPLPHALLIDMALIAIVAIFVAINYAKFHTLFQPAPMYLHEQVISNPSRMAHAGGNWMSIGNVPTVLYAYTSPGSIIFSRVFPWVYLQENLRLLPGQHMDGLGPFASVTTSMPVFVILGLAGIIHLLRRPIHSAEADNSARAAPAIVLIGSLAPIAAMLAFSSVDNRYLHEFFPLLIISSAFGLIALLRLKRGSFRAISFSLLLLIGTGEIYANIAYALVYQRLRVYDRPLAPEMQMRSWQQTIDRLL